MVCQHRKRWRSDPPDRAKCFDAMMVEIVASSWLPMFGDLFGDSEVWATVFDSRAERRGVMRVESPAAGNPGAAIAVPRPACRCRRAPPVAPEPRHRQR